MRTAEMTCENDEIIVDYTENNESVGTTYHKTVKEAMEFVRAFTSYMIDVLDHGETVQLRRQ